MRSGPGAARTILLFHIISARPSKQLRMVRTFLKVHTRPRLAYPLRSQNNKRRIIIEVTESSTNKQHHLSLAVEQIHPCISAPFREETPSC